MKKNLEERFKEEMWALNKNGNYQSAFIYLRSVLGQKLTIDGVDVDFDFLASRYRDHIIKYQFEHGHKTPDQLRFIKTEDRIQTVQQFLADGGFKRNYEIVRSARDKYLFGSASLESLTKSLEEWKETVNQRKRKLKI